MQPGFREEQRAGGSWTEARDQAAGGYGDEPQRASPSGWGFPGLEEAERP